MGDLCLLLGILACGGDAPPSPIEPKPSVPTAVRPAGGNEQAGRVGTVLPNRLRVRVTAHDDRGVSGVRVVWTASAGMISPISDTTDVNGYAFAEWVLGTLAGSQHAAATVASLGTVPFTATATPGEAAMVGIESARTTYRVGLTGELRAAAKDHHGNTVPDSLVAWTSTAPQIVEVSSTGKVAARSEGHAFIIAAAGSARDSVAIVVSGLAWLQVDVGNYHTCAIRGTGEAYCWGQNSSGEVGDGTMEDRHVPTRVAGGHEFVSISTGWVRSCGVTRGGEAYCWGSLSYLDGSPPVTTSVPVRVAHDLLFAEIAVGSIHECARTPGLEVYCWGNNQAAQLGSVVGSTQIPQRVPGHFTELQTAGSRNCGRRPSGEVYCWGANAAAHVRPEMPAFPAFATGPQHTCGIDGASALHCWGMNHGGQLGTPASNIPTPAPQRIPLSFDATAVYAGAYQTCALEPSGALWCWGMNDYGQLGNGRETEEGTGEIAPQRVLLSQPVAHVSLNATRWHQCAITRDGDLYCWGFNGKGAVGDGSTVDKLQPVMVAEP